MKKEEKNIAMLMYENRKDASDLIYHYYLKIAQGRLST